MDETRTQVKCQNNLYCFKILHVSLGWKIPDGLCVDDGWCGNDELSFKNRVSGCGFFVELKAVFFKSCPYLLTPIREKVKAQLFDSNLKWIPKRKSWAIASATFFLESFTLIPMHAKLDGFRTDYAAIIFSTAILQRDKKWLLQFKIYVRLCSFSQRSLIVWILLKNNLWKMKKN